MAKQPDIELIALTKRYGEAIAVDAINLRIPVGTYCCLLGPSGCGKTTTLRMMAGHEEASEGDVKISEVIAQAVELDGNLGRANLVHSFKLSSPNWGGVRAEGK